MNPTSILGSFAAFKNVPVPLVLLSSHSRFKDTQAFLIDFIIAKLSCSGQTVKLGGNRNESIQWLTTSGSVLKILQQRLNAARFWLTTQFLLESRHC